MVPERIWSPGGAGSDWVIGDTGQIDTQEQRLLSTEITGANDTIVTREGNDWVLAGLGDDTVITGEGTDSVLGDAGAMTYGSNLVRPDYLASDSVNGGDDAIQTGNGDSFVIAGMGSDQISALNGLDIVLADLGFIDNRIPRYESSALFGDDDSVDVGAGGSFVFGGLGNDSLTSRDGNERDFIFGDNGYVQGPESVLEAATLTPESGGDDIIELDGGADVIMAGNGADQLFGGDGIDVLIGDHASLKTENGNRRFDTTDPGLGGNDILNGGADNDMMIGGKGNDEFIGDFTEDSILGNFGQITDSTNFSGSGVSSDPGNRELIAELLFDLYNYSVYDSQNPARQDRVLSLQPVLTSDEARALTSQELLDFLRSLPVDDITGGSVGNEANIAGSLSELEAPAAGDDQSQESNDENAERATPSSGSDNEQQEAPEAGLMPGVNSKTPRVEENESEDNELVTAGALLAAVASARGWQYRNRLDRFDEKTVDWQSGASYSRWQRTTSGNNNNT